MIAIDIKGVSKTVEGNYSEHDTFLESGNEPGRHTDQNILSKIHYHVTVLMYITTNKDTVPRPKRSATYKEI